MRFSSLCLLSLIFFTSAQAETQEYVFNFAEPESLNPSVEAPAQKQGVDMDGREFSDGPVKVSFTICDYGNTHARIYHSYDAGIDLRIYDGDMMNIALTDPTLEITGISVKISLSGVSGSDAWFIPSEGTWIWEEDRWEPDPDLHTTDLTLTSYQQSRITTLTVTTAEDPELSILDVNSPSKEPIYLNLQGQPINSLTPGSIVIKITDKAIRKIKI